MAESSWANQGTGSGLLLLEGAGSADLSPDGFGDGGRAVTVAKVVLIDRFEQVSPCGMRQDRCMTDSTRNPAAMQFLRRTADQSRVVNVKITRVLKNKGRKPPGQAGAFAALDRLYAENSEALRRLADG